MTIEELLKVKGMVEFGFKNSSVEDEPDGLWNCVYKLQNDWDLDRLIICSIVLLLKKHEDYYNGLSDMFLIYDGRLYIKGNHWSSGHFLEICGNIRGICIVMGEIGEFIPGSNMSYLLGGMMGVEV